MKKLPAAAAFSLVELTLALGIAAFCLITVFALMPVGALTNRNATSQTAATNIVAAVVADLRATPKTNTTSAQFCISFATSGTSTLYFDSAGQCLPISQVDKPLWILLVSPSQHSLSTEYNMDWPERSPIATYADVKVTWPAAAAPAPMPSGSVETFAAFARN